MRINVTMTQRGGNAETISYDHLAAGFDHRRPLVDGVPAAIRAAILAELTAQPRVRPRLRGGAHRLALCRSRR
jgi:hypothetical protein